MEPRHNRAADGALLLSLGAGAACFFLSLSALLWLGFATGFEHFKISFTPYQKKEWTWWEILSLLVSLGLSVFAAEVIFRHCKKYTRDRVH